MWVCSSCGVDGKSGSCRQHPGHLLLGHIAPFQMPRRGMVIRYCGRRQGCAVPVHVDHSETGNGAQIDNTSRPKFSFSRDSSNELFIQHQSCVLVDFSCPLAEEGEFCPLTPSAPFQGTLPPKQTTLCRVTVDPLLRFLLLVRFFLVWESV